MSDAPHIVCRPQPGITPEQARNARARAWAYVFECWQAGKGGLHDLTNDSTPKIVENGPRKTEQERT